MPETASVSAELSRLQEELRRERARRQAAEFARAVLQAAFWNLDGGVLVLDADRVLFANPAVCETFGMTSDRLLRMTRDQFLREIAALFDDRPEFLALMRDGSPSAVARQEEFEMQRPRWRRLRWVGKPLQLPTGGGQMALFTDITTDTDLTSAREDRALTDQLTSLSNRRGGEQSIAREVARCERTGRPLSFVMFDVDHFKRVNDTHGHFAGDAVLKKVSQYMRLFLRRGDIAVRWGGEEFLVILSEVGLDDARVFAERVRTAVELLDLGEVGRITVSAGVAEFVPGEDAQETIARADANLYEAKQQGRNRVV